MALNNQELKYKTVKLDAKLYPIPVHRKAYTDETLAVALRKGTDPSGRKFNPVMPRFILQDSDMAVMIAYLHTLSSQVPDGVSDTTIKFATVITDDVSAADADAMVRVLDNYVLQKNNLANFYARNQKSARMAASMLLSSEVMYKKLTLSRWKLTGPPDTWRGQLEDYLRKDPVFAFLGGISGSSWQPIHEFCEAHRIPCLFPQTDYPVISDTDWYTLYLTKGVYQEGDSTARYLNNLEDALQGKTIIQVVRDSLKGRTLARGFQDAWHDSGRPAPQTIVLKKDDKLSMETLRTAATINSSTILVVWDGPEILAELEKSAAGKSSDTPGMVFLSSSYLGSSIWKIPENMRSSTYISYPYRLPQNETRYKGVVDYLTRKHSYTGNEEDISKRSYATTQLLTFALMDMRGNYYRDNFFDVLGMVRDQDLPLYERLTFGPSQRFASKGCFIVQLGTGPKPQLVAKSGWVIF